MKLSIVFGIFLVPFLIALLTWAAIRVIGVMRRNRFQYSLRTLLLIVTAFAVLLSVITTWNQWLKAQIEFLDLDSPLVSTWKEPPVIRYENDAFRVTYRPQHRELDEILKASRDTPFEGPFTGCSSEYYRQIAYLESRDRQYIELKLASLIKYDVLQNDSVTIQGVIKNADEKPVSNANIYLVPYDILLSSRGDGTFFLPLKHLPHRSDYYLMIRYGRKSMNTRMFSLDSTRPEIFVVIHVK